MKSDQTVRYDTEGARMIIFFFFFSVSN